MTSCCLTMSSMLMQEIIICLLVSVTICSEHLHVSILVIPDILLGSQSSQLCYFHLHVYFILYNVV